MKKCPSCLNAASVQYALNAHSQRAYLNICLAFSVFVCIFTFSICICVVAVLKNVPIMMHISSGHVFILQNSKLCIECPLKAHFNVLILRLSTTLLEKVGGSFDTKLDIIKKL